MKTLLESLVIKNKIFTQEGKLADYIPELIKANPSDLGIFILDIEGNEYFAGEYDTKFTVQSISKVVALMLALLDNGEEFVFSKVGMDPSGDPFNSIRKLETSSRKKPYNPMINAGAIAISSMIKGLNVDHKFNNLLNFFKLITEDSSLELNTAVYLSESETGNKNRAMGYFLKSDGIISGNVEEALSIYFRQCSINVTAKTIARLGLFLARDGKLSSGVEIVPPRFCKIVKALMITCGMYDNSGEFAVRVGLPSKSGVGGGIVSVVPNKMGIGVFSPALDPKGNSLAGICLLEDLCNELKCRIF